MTDNEQCGYETAEGTPCQLSGSREDGRCYHHTEVESPSHGGRPTKFTEERKERLLEAAERGTSKKGCARAAGIAYETLRSWLEDDSKDEFSASFRRARARGEQELVDEVKQRNPQFVLERSYEYFNTERREVDGEHEHDHEHSGEVGVSLPQETAERIANAFVYGSDDDSSSE